MSGEQPFFSVLIPAYNRPGFLAAAVRSVLENGFPSLEVLVSEDHSPRQKEIVELLAEIRDPRLQVFAQDQNLGWSRNRNFLMTRARGEYVWLMGDDDLLAPEALARLQRFIARRPGHAIYACGYEVIDEFDRHQYLRRAARELSLDRQDHFTFRQLLLAQAVPFWLFHPFTFAFRRELGAKFPYRPEALIGDDLLFLFEAVRAGHSIAVTPAVLFRWRKFSSAATQAGQQTNLSSAINGLRARAAILDLLETDPAWRPELRRLFPRRDFARRFLHDSLRADSSPLRPLLREIIAREPQLSARFLSYAASLDGGRKFWIRLRMVAAYVRLNGPEGVGELLRRIWRENLTFLRVWRLPN